MNIVRIIKLKNVRIKNIHNNTLFPKQDVLEIEFENGEIRKIDLFSEKDITDIDYFEIETTPKTRCDIIFEDKDFFNIPF